MQIVITEGATVSAGDIDLSVFNSLGELIVYDYTAGDELLERVKDADAVLCNKCVFTADILRHCKNLKYIGLFATGYNNIDIATAKELGIRVCNAGSYSNDAVVQHTFGLILNYFSKIKDYAEFCEQDGWKKSRSFSPIVFATDEIAGKTLGIVGFGCIGKGVAKIAKAFNMNVIAHTRTPKSDTDIEFVGFDELLRRSDIISVHCPLNEKTEGMFNIDAFKKCKPSAYFINTARGPIVVEKDLAFALNNGILAGAAVDVLCNEPMVLDCELSNAKNITITPHSAWSPRTTRQRLVNIVYQNLNAFKNGEKQNVIV